MAGRQWVKEMLRDFVFSFSQGAAAAAKTPGARGGAASLAASLQAPQLRQDMIRQTQTDEADRQLKIQQIRQQLLTGQQDQAFKMIAALRGQQQPTQTMGADLGPMQGGVSKTFEAPIAPVNVPGMGNVGIPNRSDVAQGELQEFEQQERIRTDQNIRQNAPQLAAQEAQRATVAEQNRLNAAAQEQERLRQEANRISDNARADRALAQTKEIADANRAAADARAARTANAKAAEIEAAKARGELTPAQSSTALRLSNALKSHPAYTDMLDIATGMQGVETGLAQKNGFGDITAINSFQRMVDPGATVRSEDVTLLSSARGVLDMINTQYPIDKLQSGAKLPEAVRARMLATAKALHEKRGKNYNDTVGSQYRKLAEASGIPFDYVGVDFAIGGAPAAGVPAGVDPAVWNVMTPQERALWRN